MKIMTLTIFALSYFFSTVAFTENYLGLKPLVYQDEDIPWINSPAAAGEQVKVILGTEDTAGQFTFITSKFTTADTVVTPHKHNWHDETFYVIRGSFLITNGDVDEKIVVREGATVFSPRGTWHSWEANEADSQLVMFYTPSGFDKVLPAALELTPEQRNDREYMEAFALRYDSIRYVAP